jgi:hypothetical protein
MDRPRDNETDTPENFDWDLVGVESDEDCFDCIDDSSDDSDDSDEYGDDIEYD